MCFVIYSSYFSFALLSINSDMLRFRVPVLNESLVDIDIVQPYVCIGSTYLQVGINQSRGLTNKSMEAVHVACSGG